MQPILYRFCAACCFACLYFINAGYVGTERQSVPVYLGLLLVSKNLANKSCFVKEVGQNKINVQAGSWHATFSTIWNHRLSSKNAGGTKRWDEKWVGERG